MRKNDGMWNFAFLKEKLENFNVTGTQFKGKCCVPGCFNLLPGSAFLRGIGAYRTRVRAGGMTRLVLEGFGLCGRVFWDGREIFTPVLPFAMEKADFDAGTDGVHELVMACENTFDTSESSMFSLNSVSKGFIDEYRRPKTVRESFIKTLKTEEGK